MLINPSEGNPYAPSGRTDDLTSLETEARLVSADDVLRAAASDLEGMTPERLRSELDVQVPVNTQILQVSVQDTDPEVARTAAQVLATTYLEERRSRTEAVVQSQSETIKRRISEISAQLRDASTSGDSTAQVQATVTALNSELINLRGQQIGVANTSSYPGRIISPAGPAVAQGRLLPLVYPAVGLAIGLLVGWGLSMALARRRRSSALDVRDVEDAGIPVVATVVGSRRGRGSGADGWDEAVRQVRAEVLDLASPPATVAVTAAGAGEPSGPVSFSLARSLAGVGHSVVLVDAESDTRAQGGGRQQGLTDLLGGPYSDPGPLLQHTGDPRFRLLPPGRTDTRNSEHFVGGRLAPTLDSLRRHGDFVIVSCTDLQTTQGQAVARAADLTLVVVILGQTTRSDLQAAVRKVEGADARVIGALVLSSSPSSRHTMTFGPGGASAPRGHAQERVG